MTITVSFERSALLTHRLDSTGFARDHTEDFRNIRKLTNNRSYLEVTRLEKRLTKLTQLLTSPPPEQLPGTGGLLWPISGAKNQRKLLEQSVVTWEDDTAVPRCPFCQQEFSNYSFRRHHCRLCGRVVCGDPRTGCSSEVGLNVAASMWLVLSSLPRTSLTCTGTGLSEKAAGQTSLDIRMCRECKNIIFSKKDFASELAQKPADLKAYENLVEFERGIRLLMPRFHRLLVILQYAHFSLPPRTYKQLTQVQRPG